MKTRRSITMVTTVDLGVPNACTTHILAIADGLALRGRPTTLIAPAPSAVDGQVPQVPQHARLVTAKALRAVPLPRASLVLTVLPALVRSILRGNAETVYVRTNALTIVLVAVARLLRCRVVSEHNGWIASELRALDRPRAWISLAQQTQVWEARLAHRNRVVTTPLAGLLEAAGVAPDSVFVAGNGTDTKSLRPDDRNGALQRRGLPTEPRYIGFLGNLASWQGVEVAIEALAILRTRGIDARLLVIGDGPERQALEAATHTQRVEEATHFLGYVGPSGLRSALACLDVAVAPFVRSRNAEVGLSPLKIRDYAAMGLPVVASALPGIEELAEEGWLVLHAVDDPQSLAAAVAGVLDNDAHREAMSIAARRHAEEHFGWERVVETIHDHLPSGAGRGAGFSGRQRRGPAA